MKTPIIYRILLAALFTMIAAGKSLAQSEGTLIPTESLQKAITRVQDNAATRALNRQTENSYSPVQKAREISSVLSNSLKAKDLEGASSAYWNGMEAGVPKTLEALRDSRRAEAKEAAQDAVDLIQETVRRAGRNAAPTIGQAADLSGEAASVIAGDMRTIEKEKRELDEDLRKEVESLGKSFPELRPVLQQSGLTSASVRELVISRLREANQLVYQAGIYETNLLVWKNMPRIIKSRYVNGGNPQVITAQNASEVIKASEADKFFK